MINHQIQNLPRLMMQVTLLLIILMVSNFSLSFAQEETASQASSPIRVIVPRQKVSPLAMATFFASDSTYVKVTYGQPYKKERDIFGGIVPFGEIWRTGANEATEITFTKDVYFANKKLKAGSYTLFTIPGEDTWKIILNKVLGQWGAYKYDDVKVRNVLEVEVPVSASRNRYEAFTIEFSPSREGADMRLIWDLTQIIIPIRFLNH